MTGLCIGLALLLALVAALLIAACVKIECLQEHIRSVENDRVDHAKCLGMIAGLVTDEFAARMLDAAADEYESMDGMAEQSRIANTLYQPGGPGVPVLYLRERAARLRERPVNP